MISGSTFLCCFAAVLFWVCNAIEIILGVKQSKRFGSVDKEIYTQLLPDNIIDDWINKVDGRSLEFASGFLKGSFWIIFCLPIIEMAWILSRNGTRALGWNVGIALFVLGGSWTKWFSSIFWNGMYISFIQLATVFNLDDWLRSDLLAKYNIDGEDGIGWRALEVNYIVGRGLVWIVNAVEWICLSAIFTFTFVSVVQWRKEDDTTFGARWNALGLFIGLLAVVEFASEIVGFEGYRIAWIFVILYAALNRLILIPVWIIILGFQLPNATAKHFDSFDANYLASGELVLSEDQQRQQRQERRPSTFTIDEDDDGIQGGEASAASNSVAGPPSPPAEAFTKN